MFRKITFVLSVLVVSAALISAITNGNGAPYKTTGSPGDGKDCTHCHSGTASTANFITTNIPASGYFSGKTYTITITATKSGINKFGFELTAEDSNNAKKGTFTITNSTETKMVADEVTHTGNGVTGSNGSKTWSVSWTAPPAGTGTVTFYSAVNAANGDGGTAGDEIILSSLAVQEDPANAIAQHNDNKTKIFPTTASTYININAKNAVAFISVFDVSGKRVLNKYFPAGTFDIRLDISAFPKGFYFMEIETGGKRVVKKFVRK